jgi:hypothetical protein
MELGMVSSADELPWNFIHKWGACRMGGEEKPTEIEPHGAIAPPSEQNLKEWLINIKNSGGHPHRGIG